MNMKQQIGDHISDSVVTDMCAQKSYTAREGYIATPNFPTEYPTSMDCRCSLQVGYRVSHLSESEFFLSKTFFLQYFNIR